MKQNNNNRSEVELTKAAYISPWWRIILCMHTANERWRYKVTPSLIGWTHTQNDPCSWERLGDSEFREIEKMLKNVS